MYDPYAEFTKHVLPNGLEVHSVFWDRPWVRVEVVVHSGGREDPLEIPGLAHFVEHVVSENIPKRKLDEVKALFDACGGRASFGRTNYLTTRYAFCIPANSGILREALAIFGSMLLEAQIEDYIERERSVILREFNGRYPFHEKLEWDLAARRALFKGHRLETWNRPLGLPEGFLKATKDDLQGFYSRHYVPANISLVVVGGFKTEEVITELEKSPFGKMKDGRRNPIPEPFDHIPTPREHERMVKLSDHFSFKVDQTEYRATWAFPGSFPRQARKVFSIVLSEVLFDQIRQKRGLAYSIGSSFTSFQDICEFSIQGSVRPEVTLDINGLVGECIDMVPSRPDLFERKLRSCIQRCFMTDLSGEELGDTSADWLSMHHRIITIQETLRELHLVTFEQMAEAAALLSPEKQYTFITSP